MKISNKEVRVVLSDDAEEVYKYLASLEEIPKNQKEIAILKAFEKKKEMIKQRPGYENTIEKAKYPKEYIKKYGITNLFRIELPNYWRAIYTMSSGDSSIEVIAFVIEICDHTKYNKIFGYKKK